MKIIGVDPGESGAVCILCSLTGKMEMVRNSEGLHEIASALRTSIEKSHCKAFVEKVNAMPKQGVST